jgi:hypothetical protein
MAGSESSDESDAYRHLVCRMTPGLYLAALFIVTGPAADAEAPTQLGPVPILEEAEKLVLPE